MASDTPRPTTVTDDRLRGRRVGNLVAWRGIPYAAPPVGDTAAARAHSRSRHGPESETRPSSATPPVQHKKGLRCAREVPAEQRGLSDTQRARSRERRFRPASGDGVHPRWRVHHRDLGHRPLPGRSLVERGDIVYVSINYRLGALGYLDFTQFSTPERTFDSNLGLRDQVAALRMGAAQYRRIRWRS